MYYLYSSTTISGTGAISDSAFSSYDNDDSVRKKISTNVKTVVINEGITEIGSLAFDCCRCTSIKLPNSLEIIRISAFYCCRITSIEIPDSVTTIESAAFNMCASLERVKLPAHINIIKELTFAGCDKLEFIDIPLSVEKIEKKAFSSCCSPGLELNIPCNVELEFNNEGILGSMGYANSFCGIINVVPDSDQEEYFVNNYANEISDEKITLNTTLSHNFSNRVENEDGTYVEICSICGEEKTAREHKLIKVEGIEATCLENGMKEYWYCEICNCYFADDKATVEIVEDIDSWKVIQADGHKYYWHHTDTMGNGEYDLLCAGCTENFGCGYLDGDNKFYMYGYVKNGGYYHYIFDGNAVCLGSEKCEIDYWNSDESYHEGVCKCHLILCEEELHDYVIQKCDSNTHWMECSKCESASEVKKHCYDNDCDNICNDCGFVRTTSHTYETVISVATTSSDGSRKQVCNTCGEVKNTEVIHRISTIKLSKTEYTYNGSKKTPSVTVKDSKGNKLVNGEDYKLTYSSSKRTAVGRYSVKVTFMGDYNDTKTLHFSIGPKNPSSVKAVLCGYDDIRVSWSEVSGAHGYKVYYKKSTTSTWSAKKTTGTSVKIANLSDGVKYDIKVVAYKTKDGYQCYNTGKSTSIYTLKKVTGVKVKKSGTKVKVSWTNISGETGYQISKSTKKTGTNIVDTYETTSGKYKSVSATKGKTYYYKIRAYKIVEGKKIYGPWSKVVKYVRK